MNAVKAKPLKQRPETANAITANVLRIINSTPHAVAWRINNVGVWDATRKVYRAGNTAKGLPDVWGCYKGRFFTVEVKAKKDKLSEHQERIMSDIESAGGYPMVARSTDDFISAWKEFL